jgi:hypothetical protein
VIKLFRKSFKKLYKKPSKELEDMPLVASLTMEKLEADVEETTITPLVCKHCGGILTDYSKLQEKDDSLYSWKCDFCENQNEIKIAKIEEKREIEKRKGITSEELSILFKEIVEDKKKVDPEKKEAKIFGDSLVAIIDISGSMSSGKLDAVKHSLVQTIKDMKVNNPNTVFSLIEFTDDVRISSAPHKTIILDKDDELFSKDKLRKSLKNKLKSVKIGSVGEFGDKWISKIESLRTMGWTALGPGLFSGQVLIEEKILSSGAKSSRIIILTDGLANVGMGKIEGVSEKESKKFYELLASECLKKGIIIDVIGVTDGSNSVALNIVGVTTDITGGEMVLITREQIESTMKTMRQKKYIARNTILRVFMPPYLELEGITGAYISGDIPKESGVPINLGALDPDREMYLRFKQKTEIKDDKIPIQIQMEYLDKNNVKKIRVIRSNVEITDNFEDYSKGYDAELYANIEIQRAGKLYQDDDIDGARGVLSTLGTTLGSAKYKSVLNKKMAFDLAESEEETYSEREEMAEEMGLNDMKSFSSTMGQSFQRKSLSKRKMEMKERKKKK